MSLAIKSIKPHVQVIGVEPSSELLLLLLLLFFATFCEIFVVVLQIVRRLWQQ
jgi:hypothetical protein